LPGNERNLESFAKAAKLLQILTDNQYATVWITFQHLGNHFILGGVLTREPIFQRHSATAYSIRIEGGKATRISQHVASRSTRVSPTRARARHISWTDQGKNVALSSIFSDERGGQAQAPPRLDLRGDAKNRRRQQMHLVIK